MFAQMNNVIIFLIAHPTKMNKNAEGIYDTPTLYDVAGSADFRNQTHDGFCIYRTFGDESFTTFTNLKTKMSFQGEIGSSIDFDYHIPSGRYYERGTQPPTYSLMDYKYQESNYSEENDVIKDLPLTFVASVDDAFDIDSVPF
jgi:twinkle protein